VDLYTARLKKLLQRIHAVHLMARRAARGLSATSVQNFGWHLVVQSPGNMLAWKENYVGCSYLLIWWQSGPQVDSEEIINVQTCRDLMHAVAPEGYTVSADMLQAKLFVPLDNREAHHNDLTGRNTVHFMTNAEVASFCSGKGIAPVSLLALSFPDSTHMRMAAHKLRNARWMSASKLHYSSINIRPVEDLHEAYLFDPCKHTCPRTYVRTYRIARAKDAVLRPMFC